MRITDGNGRAYHLSPARGNTGRVEIRPVFGPTSYWFERGDRKPITCSRGRGPEAVAGDVTRRLAPCHEAVLAKIRHWDAVRHVEDTARLALATVIEAAFPPGCVHRPSHCQTQGRTELVIYGPGHLGGRIRLFADAGDVELESVRVPRAVAIARLACFADVCQPQDTP